MIKMISINSLDRPETFNDSPEKEANADEFSALLAAILPVSTEAPLKPKIEIPVATGGNIAASTAGVPAESTHRDSKSDHLKTIDSPELSAETNNLSMESDKPQFDERISSGAFANDPLIKTKTHFQKTNRIEKTATGADDPLLRQILRTEPPSDSNAIQKTPAVFAAEKSFATGDIEMISEPPHYAILKPQNLKIELFQETIAPTTKALLPNIFKSIGANAPETEIVHKTEIPLKTESEPQMKNVLEAEIAPKTEIMPNTETALKTETTPKAEIAPQAETTPKSEMPQQAAIAAETENPLKKEFTPTEITEAVFDSPQKNSDSERKPSMTSQSSLFGGAAENPEKLERREMKNHEGGIKVFENIFTRTLDEFAAPEAKNAAKSSDGKPLIFDGEKVLEQVSKNLEVEILAFAAKPEKANILKLRLRPAELGAVEVSLEKTDSGKLNAVLQTETDAAREILVERAEQLRDALQSSGWDVERLDISLGSSSAAGNENRENQTRQFENVESDLPNGKSIEDVSESGSNQNRLVSLRA